MLIPIRIVSGVGEANRQGDLKKAAYHAALRDAGTSSVNINALSSVIPAVPVIEQAVTLFPHHGQKIDVVEAAQYVSERGIWAAAGIGWVQDASNRGYFVECKATGPTKESVEQLVNEDLRTNLESMLEGDILACDLDNLHTKVASIECTGKPVYAVVQALYRLHESVEGTANGDMLRNAGRINTTALGDKKGWIAEQAFAVNDLILILEPPAMKNYSPILDAAYFKGNKFASGTLFAEDLVVKTTEGSVRKGPRDANAFLNFDWYGRPIIFARQPIQRREQIVLSKAMVHPAEFTALQTLDPQFYAELRSKRQVAAYLL